MEEKDAGIYFFISSQTLPVSFDAHWSINDPTDRLVIIPEEA